MALYAAGWAKMDSEGCPGFGSECIMSAKLASTVRQGSARTDVMVESLASELSRWAPARQLSWTLLLLVALRPSMGFGRSPPSRETAEPIHVRLDNVSDCPDARSFWTKLRGHTPRVRSARPNERARTFRVSVVQGQQRVLGRLVTVDVKGHRSERNVSGATCQSVIDALALSAALAVDPKLLEPATASSPSTSLPTTDQEPPAPTPPPDATPVRGDTGEPRASNWKGSAGACVSHPLIPMRPRFLALGAFVGIGKGGPALLAPDLRIAGLGGLPTTQSTSAGSARLTWATLRIRSCAVRWSPARGAMLRGCALADIGRIRGKGQDTSNPDEPTLLWVATGTAARVELALPGRSWVAAGPNLVFPLRRHRFYFTPDITAYRLPVAILGAELSAGVRVF